MIMEH